MARADYIIITHKRRSLREASPECHCALRHTYSVRYTYTYGQIQTRGLSSFFISSFFISSMAASIVSCSLVVNLEIQFCRNCTISAPGLSATYCATLSGLYAKDKDVDPQVIILSYDNAEERPPRDLEIMVSLYVNRIKLELYWQLRHLHFRE